MLVDGAKTTYELHTPMPTVQTFTATVQNRINTDLGIPREYCWIEPPLDVDHCKADVKQW